jgi:glycosyltransferase
MALPEDRGQRAEVRRTEDRGKRSDFQLLSSVFRLLSSAQLISEPDHGIYDALNKGLRLATGDIIGFLHADDRFASNTILEKITRAFENKEVDGIYGNLVFTNAENKVVRTWQSKPFHPKNVRHGWMPPHPTLFLRKEVYKKHGLFDTSFKIAGDYDFMLRVMTNPEMRLRYLPVVITRMRLGGASTGSIKGIIQKMREDIRALRNNGFHYPFAILPAKNPRKLPQLLKR